jgi:phosphate transport system protein
MKREHTDHEYEQELRRLREHVLLMGAKVEDVIGNSIKALVEGDSALAQRMIDSDSEIDALEVETDDLCLKILARRQPVASDLRVITITMKMVTDLERIGDLGVNISERVIELNAEPPLKPYVDLPQMAEIARGMMRDALDAFVHRDTERAAQVIARDETVDAFYAQVFRELLTYMMEDPRNIYRATRLQSIAKYLERIGDHATNLAENVIFMAKGKDVRHSHPRSLPRGVLFLCVGNSARSQMAEGWARHLLPATVRIWSAGSQPAAAVNPNAVRVMREAGIDISGQRPKRIDEVPLGEVDTVITLCSEEICPVLPGDYMKEAWRLPDPAAVVGGAAEVEAAFRATRDEIRVRLQELVEG